MGLNNAQNIFNAMPELNVKIELFGGVPQGEIEEVEALKKYQLAIARLKLPQLQSRYGKHYYSDIMHRVENLHACIASSIEGLKEEIEGETNGE